MCRCSIALLVGEIARQRLSWTRRFGRTCLPPLPHHLHRPDPSIDGSVMVSDNGRASRSISTLETRRSGVQPDDHCCTQTGGRIGGGSYAASGVGLHEVLVKAW